MGKGGWGPVLKLHCWLALDASVHHFHDSYANHHGANLPSTDREVSRNMLYHALRLLIYL
jgi:hypothetical protein